MDYMSLIDTFRGVACVVCIRKNTDEDREEVVIAAANKNYLASVNKLGEEFVPYRPYTYYISYDPNFEALVNNCVSDRKIAHQYVNAELYRSWLDLYMIPLEDGEDGNRYCLFTYEMTPMSDSDKLIDISAQTAYTVLKTCIKLRENDDFVATMNSIVKDIRNQCESQNCAMALINDEEERIDVLCYDRDSRVPELEGDVFHTPAFYWIVKKWSDFIAGSNCFIISNEEELKTIEAKDTEWYNSLVSSGINNLVLYPLRVGSNLYGYIFATNFNSDKTPFIREVMELNSFVLSAEVENFRMRQKLEKFSRVDMLTGVLNSNAMNKRVDELSSSEDEDKRGIGVIFVDVNGLKIVNDTKGHSEGDLILKKVAHRLRTVFGEDEVFRAGGDEFIIIVSGMDRDKFEALFEKLGAIAKIEGEPSFSLGACYDDTDADVKKAMRTADKNMYSNKAEYYKANPEVDRRNIVRR